MKVSFIGLRGFLSVLVVLCVVVGTGAETCLSPFIRVLDRPEKYLYVWSVDADQKDNDFLAVVDVDIASPTFQKVIAQVDVGSKGNEPHHMGFTDDRTRIFANSLLSSRIFIFDAATDPARPRLIRTIENFTELTGLSGPHTSYAIPGRMLIACLGGADGGLPAGIAEFTNDGNYIRTIRFDAATPYGYDIAIKPEINRMATSSFTPKRNYSRPFAKFDLKDFSNKVLIWDFKTRQVVQVGETDNAPLEVRWARRPGNNYGFTNCALGNSLWIWKQKPDGSFEFKKVADTGALPVDLRQTADDRYLFVSSFGTHEIQQFDITDPEHPKLVSTVVPGLHPNMMHLTYDAKRLYVTNSLLSTMDYGAEHFWVRLVRIGPDGMKVDPFFNVDFSNLPTGPARPHDMLLN
jgi:selenium-binding protein 1